MQERRPITIQYANKCKKEDQSQFSMQMRENKSHNIIIEFWTYYELILSNLF